jgi:anti-sigma factor RsiW
VTLDHTRNGGDPAGEPYEGPTCKEIVELTTAYLEEYMPQAERRAFEEHIGLCPECATYLDQMRQTIATLGELREESLTPQQRTELLEAFRGWHAR